MNQLLLNTDMKKKKMLGILFLALLTLTVLF